jgi:hypothetical protein
LIIEQIRSDQEKHVRHEAVNVPDHRNPFQDEDAETEFHKVLAKVIEHGIEPAGYGLHSDEWEEDSYPVLEFIRAGNRGGKEIQVSLEDPIWKDRARLWVQGLNVLAHFVT